MKFFKVFNFLDLFYILNKISYLIIGSYKKKKSLASEKKMNDLVYVKYNLKLRNKKIEIFCSPI